MPLVKIEIPSGAAEPAANGPRLCMFEVQRHVPRLARQDADAERRVDECDAPGLCRLIGRRPLTRRFCRGTGSTPGGMALAERSFMARKLRRAII